MIVPPDAGRSGSALTRKLGIEDGHRVQVLGAPAGFALDLPDGVRTARNARGYADVILAFFTERSALEKEIRRLRNLMEPASGLWIAWPKRASRMRTDLTEDVVRDVALSNRLVDNKVCAIDETWSGLRLVIRVADRP